MEQCYSRIVTTIFWNNLCACVCLCKCLCMYVYMHVLPCVHLCAHAYMCALCVQVHVYVHVYVHTCACTQVFTCTCIHAPMCVCVCRPKVNMDIFLSLLTLLFGKVAHRTWCSPIQLSWLASLFESFI